MKKVEISSATLSAIKNLLFANDGVNIKPLVEDLKVGETNEDLLAINVALVMQGAKPNICEKSRYKIYDNVFYRYDFVSYSLILDVVTCVETKFKRLENGDGEQLYREKTFSMTLSDWENLPTSIQ